MIESSTAPDLEGRTSRHVPRPRLSALVMPFWKSKSSFSAWLLVAVILVLTFGTAPIYVYQNGLTGQVADGLVNRQWQALAKAIAFTAGVGVFASALIYIQVAIQQVVEIKWRTHLTEQLLEKWLRNNVFAEIEREQLISNADQRISEDARLFVERTLNLAFNVVGMIVGTATYSVILWKLSQTLNVTLLGVDFAIQGYMFYVSVIYCLVAFLVTHWVGKQMIGLSMRRQGVEADFRFGAMRVRENAEQIAFYRGSDEELRGLKVRFSSVRENFKAIIARQFKIGTASSTYTAFFEPLPTVAALPLYIAGKITVGGIAQLTDAYVKQIRNLTLFSQAYTAFAEWLAVANRLKDLLWIIEKAQVREYGIDNCSSHDGALAISSLVLRNPMGQKLTQVPDLEIRPGERVLLTGASGTGKSTLLRALAGMWPHGSGWIRFPTTRAMFLPQRSYIPDGTVKAALCYPCAIELFSDQDCKDVLTLCGLSDRLPSLTEINQWQQLLSGGEQQRLALARVLLHKPALLFLDEATSAVDPQTEETLYRLLVERLPDSAIVSVAHRESLSRFHDREVRLTRAT